MSIRGCLAPIRILQEWKADECISGRKLTWLWHVMKAELRTTYLAQKYIFMTNAYQMAILCQFNENDSHSWADLLAGTRLSETALKGQLGLLVKAKVLLQEGDTYDLNLSECLASVAGEDSTDKGRFQIQEVEGQFEPTHSI